MPTLAQTTGLPLRGLPSSGIVHLLVIVGFLLLGLAPVTLEAPRRLRQPPQRVDLQADADDAPLLPELQSSSASASSPASASSRSAPGRNGPSSASSMPLIHQRRQHIISNTPDATNPVQTILQPDLHNPPRLNKTLPVPSMVRMAPAVQRAPTLTAPVLTTVVKVAAPPAPTPPPQPTLPKVQPSTVDTVQLTSATQLADSPKLKAYATTGRAFQPPRPPPPPPAATKPSAPESSAKNAPSPASNATPAEGTDKRNLLVVNAMEVQSTLTERDIPAAEIHGRFEVTASPSMPDAPTTGGSSSSVGVNGSGIATAGNGSGKGPANSRSAAGSGSGGTRGNGSGGGTANIAGAGSGHGTGLGTGTGTGSGHTPGAGMGNGSGSAPAGGNGSAPFSGMTIVGGTGGGNSIRSAPSNASVDPNDPRGAFGLTILSHGDSGGAVRDYGVFTGGPVFTVYLDVARIGIHGARWSLQYSASRDDRLAHPGVALSAPLPQDERLPQLPPAAVTANLGRLVVIQAVIKADGRLDGFRVLESPDQHLNEGLITCLTHWYFDPAAMGGDKIPVKVLLGIPISAAMADNGVSQQADQHTPSDAASRPRAQ